MECFSYNFKIPEINPNCLTLCITYMLSKTNTTRNSVNYTLLNTMYRTPTSLVTENMDQFLDQNAIPFQQKMAHKVSHILAKD